jgi:hypothetical protein
MANTTAETAAKQQEQQKRAVAYLEGVPLVDEKLLALGGVVHLLCVLAHLLGVRSTCHHS